MPSAVIAVLVAGGLLISGCSGGGNFPPAGGIATESAAGAEQFSGTYQVESTVTAVSGSYDETVGQTHTYTWVAVPSCSAGSCGIEVKSSTGSSYEFRLRDGVLAGTGAGVVECYLPGTEEPSGATGKSALAAKLRPTGAETPAQKLTGTVHLTVPAGTCGAGSGDFDYVLTRTGGSGQT
jgi:hypothetical protein